jgi:IS605 OrfB family transposase
MNNLNIRKNSINNEIIKFQMLHSKNIFNSAIFFQRRWYDIIQLYQKYYFDNLNDYLFELTSNDCLILFKYCLTNKNKDKLSKIYQVYNNKKELLKYINDDELKIYLKSLPSLELCKKGRIQEANEILDNLNQYNISLYDFPDFIQNIKSVLEVKYQNELSTIENNKVKLMRLEDKNLNINELNTKISKNLIVNLIPPQYLGEYYMDLYVKMFIPSYKLIGSQVAQQTIKKVDKSYTGFFESKNEGYIKAQPPNYNRTNKFNLIFQKESFKVEDKKIRLSLGLGFKNDFDNNFNKNIEIINDGYYKKINKDIELNKKFLYLKFNNKKVLNKKITEIEIVPSTYKNSNKYKVIFKYDINKPIFKKLDNNLKKLSIDLGQVNLATLFSPILNKPIIYDGRKIIGENEYFNKKIDNHKSLIKTTFNVMTSNYVQNLLTKRTNKILDYFHYISNEIIKLCKKFDIREIIMGYNTNWKKNVNMGKKNNRTFYDIPYSKLTNMLFYKGEQNNIKVVENEESYTSKCDALGLEEVGFHNKYVGKRIKRGLFQSSKNVFLNADVNGAINIMNKYINKTYTNLIDLFNNTIETINYKYVCNPIRLKKSKMPQDVNLI